MIPPTVGCIVLFRPNVDLDNPEQVRNFLSHHPSFALADVCSAQIAAVNSDGTINLSVLDATAVPHPIQGVSLVSDDESPDKGEGFYAEWVPYQKGEAGKNDTLTPSISALEDRISELELKNEELNRRVTALDDPTARSAPSESEPDSEDNSGEDETEEQTSSPKSGRGRRNRG